MISSTPHLYQTKALGETKGGTAHGLTNLVELTTLSRSLIRWKEILYKVFINLIDLLENLRAFYVLLQLLSRERTRVSFESCWVQPAESAR